MGSQAPKNFVFPCGSLARAEVSLQFRDRCHCHHGSRVPVAAPALQGRTGSRHMAHGALWALGYGGWTKSCTRLKPWEAHGFAGKNNRGNRIIGLLERWMSGFCPSVALVSGGTPEIWGLQLGGFQVKSGAPRRPHRPHLGLLETEPCGGLDTPQWPVEKKFRGDTGPWSFLFFFFFFF